MSLKFVKCGNEIDEEGVVSVDTSSLQGSGLIERENIYTNKTIIK